MKRYDDLLEDVKFGYKNFKHKTVSQIIELDERIESDIARAYTQGDITEEQYEDLIIREGKYKYEF